MSYEIGKNEVGKLGLKLKNTTEVGKRLIKLENLKFTLKESYLETIIEVGKVKRSWKIELYQEVN